MGTDRREAVKRTGIVFAGTAAISAAAALLLFRSVRTPAPAPPAIALDAVDPAVWAKRYPLQYDRWKLPAREDARWREKRGHAFSLKDRDESGPGDDPRWSVLLAGKPILRPLPAGCLECHGAEPAAAPAYWEARRAVKTPVACISCHRPSDAARGSAVCGRCHAEYYVDNGAIRRPEGNDARSIEAFYDRIEYADWTHPATAAAVIEPRHPQFQMWSQGLHGRSGVGCADCHMPRIDAGGPWISDHRAASPLQNIDRACAACHRLSVDELRARAERDRGRIAAMQSCALDALTGLIADIRRARHAGVPEASLAAARAHHRRAQWRVMFVQADGSRGFHAPQEAAGLLIEAIDEARKGQVEANTVCDRDARKVTPRAAAVRGSPSPAARSARSPATPPPRRPMPAPPQAAPCSS